MSCNENKLIVICGPTASGKSDLYEQLKKTTNKPLECINADTGQMYKGLEVGTAKPDFSSLPNPERYHLFDILDLGKYFSAGQYRDLVKQKLDEIWAKGHQPVIVGGSMFYIFSLFFPPHDPKKLELSPEQLKTLKDKREAMSTEELYKKLSSLDPERAREIMPGDRFRVYRALEIWDEHGVLPSELEPEFKPLAQTDLVFVCQDRDELDQRIAKRLKVMLKGPNVGKSWIDEAREIYPDKQIRKFINSSRLIGYRQIVDWIDRGAKEADLGELEQDLFFATRAYSRNQIKFWRGLERKIKGKDSQKQVRITKLSETGNFGKTAHF